MDAAVKRSFKVLRATRASRAGGVMALILFAVLASFPFWADSSWLRLFAEFACFLVLAQMWNLLAGYGGLVSVGQQAFVGLGGYALVVLANHTGLNPFWCLPLAGLFAALVAMPTALIVFRLHGGYFAIGTWVVAEVYRLLFANASFLGGGSGTSLMALRGIPKATRESITFWIALVLAFGSIGLVYWLLRSRQGLALTAIRDSELAAASSGVSLPIYKTLAFGVSAAFAGVAGSLLVLVTNGFAQPNEFGVILSLQILIGAAVAGLGSLWGTLVGALFVGLLPELSSSAPLIGSSHGQDVVFGLIVVLVMILLPNGFAGLLRTIDSRVNSAIKSDTTTS